MKYLVTFATKGLDAAASFSSYQFAINYLNACIDAANIKIADFDRYAPDCFKMLLTDGRDFNIKIEPQSDVDVRYDLKIAKNGRVVETRRFVNREYAVNYAHKLLRSKGYAASALGDEEGFWAIEDINGTKYEIGIGLALLGGSKSNDFDVLGVKAGASEDEIKKAYRARVKENHPDRGGDAAKFEKIQKAYEHITKGQTSRARFVKKYYDSRDMTTFFENYEAINSLDKPHNNSNFHLDLRAELQNARQQANSTIGSGAILLALGGAILIFLAMSDGFYPLVLLATAGLIIWGIFRLICGLYYQNKIEKIIEKIKKR